MRLYATYSIKIKHYNGIFKNTIALYRKAVDFLIDVCLKEWDNISSLDGSLLRVNYVEGLCHTTKDNPDVKYGFDGEFYKFPSYLRRSAIAESVGKVSSYKSNLANWEAADPTGRGRRPSAPKAGYTYPCLYKTGMFEQTGAYGAKIKVFVRNTWDWLPVQLRKTDADYIARYCADKKEGAPTLLKRGHEWFLAFPFEEKVKLTDTGISSQTAVAVDLGINSSATVSVMRSDGAVLGRHFLKLPKEYDSLNHAVNRIKKAQQHGNRKTPRLWAKAKGINDDISVKMAAFIMDVASRYGADVIVFEHLDLGGKKHGSKRQRLHLWRAKYVQSMVGHKAHRLGMHISHVCARNTSRLAFDGSGAVARGKDAGFNTCSMCRFQSGKLYNCDLNASYNIGARYFIREVLKSCLETERLAVVAKEPRLAKRSTCTLSDLINMNAVLSGLDAV